MRECKKCGAKILLKKMIDGRQRSLKSRRYCLDCSPFKDRGRSVRTVYPDGDCVDCGRPKKRRGPRCNTCISRLRRDRVREKLYLERGTECIVCGYGGVEKIRVLEFHHIDAGSKVFNLTSDEVARRAWSEVIKEAEKCIVVCPNCHREIHLGLILCPGSCPGSSVGLQP